MAAEKHQHMICPHCDKGRVVTLLTVGQGHETIQIPEIGPCAHCGGQWHIHCCEGDRAQAMLEATDANPNERD